MRTGIDLTTFPQVYDGLKQLISNIYAAPRAKGEKCDLASSCKVCLVRDLIQSR